MVSHYFFPQKSDDFFSYRPQTDDLSLFPPCAGLPSNRLSSVVCNSAAKKIALSLGCHPPGWCHRGRPLVTPLDAAAADDDDDDAGRLLCVACGRVVSVLDATTRQRGRITQL